LKFATSPLFEHTSSGRNLKIKIAKKILIGIHLIWNDPITNFEVIRLTPVTCESTVSVANSHSTLKYFKKNSS